MRRAQPLRQGRRRVGSLRGDPDLRSNLPPGRSARSFSASAPAATPRAAHLVRRFRGSAPPARPSKRSGNTGSTRSARSTSKRPTRPSTCWPTAGCCIRLWPAACGRAAAIYQSGGAFGFRDQLQDVDGARPRRAALAARAYPAVRGAPVQGRRCAALVASAVRPRRAHALFRRLSSGWPWQPAVTSRAPATPASR